MPSGIEVFKSRRVTLLLALGFASGLPLYLSGGTLTAWMTAEGVDLKTIGIVSLVGLPYSFKFLWAPLLDRFQLPWLGRRRGWMAATELALAVAIAGMAAFDLRESLPALALVAFVVAFFSASQDIVVDAWRTDVLRPEERGAGTATFVAGYRIAMIVSGPAALTLSTWLPWRAVYLVMAALMLIGVGATLLAEEPEATPPADMVAAIVEPFRDFLARKGAVLALLFVALYKMGDAVAMHMVTPFLYRTVGFGMREIGVLNQGLGLAATIAGALAGGALLARMGQRRALFAFGVLQASTNFLYVLLALVGKSYALLVVTVGIDQLAGGLGTAAFTAYLMSLCNKRFSATQYALISSFYSVAQRFVGAGSGYVVEEIGWAWFFAATAVAATPALIILLALPPGLGGPDADAEPAREAA